MIIAANKVVSCYLIQVLGDIIGINPELKRHVIGLRKTANIEGKGVRSIVS